MKIPEVNDKNTFELTLRRLVIDVMPLFGVEICGSSGGMMRSHLYFYRLNLKR